MDTHEVVSDRQFGDEIEAGGSSRRADTTERGRPGIYVSTPGHERTRGRRLLDAQIDRHRQEILGAHTTAGYQGGWRDGELRYLDRSVRVNTRALGLGLGAAWNQQAVYDGHTDTTHNPADEAEYTGLPKPKR